MAEITPNDGCALTVRNKTSPSHEDPLIEMEMPDSPEGYEYSSGSDRSNEAEDGESSEGTPSKSKCCSRRMQRHGSHGSRRHKGGSRHKKTYQPYPPQDERNLKRRSMERKAKESAAAEVRQEGLHEFVQFPVAPFNSTQYLMDEHNVTSPTSTSVQKTPSHTKLYSPTYDKNPTNDSSQEAIQVDIDKKDKDFADVYTSVHAESLQCLSKEELVKHYMSLEEKIALLQKQVKQRNDTEPVMANSNSDSLSNSCTNEGLVDLAIARKPSISVGEDSAAPTNISGNRKISVSS